MILTSKYIDDDNHVKYAPITTPNAVRWPDGSNLNDKLGSISYNDLEDKPTNVSDFNNDAGYLTQHQDISGKADKPSSPTSGNFAALDANGNLIDSGHKHSDYITSHQDLSSYVQKSQTAGLLKNDGTVDTNTYLTTAPVTSVNGQTGVVTLNIPDVSGKEDKMTVVTQSSGTTLTAAVGNYYRFTYNVGTLDITLPTPTGSKAQSVLFFLTTGASPAVTFTSTGNTIYKNDGFAIDATTTYEINALWNGGAWVINAVKYTT